MKSGIKPRLDYTAALAFYAIQTSKYLASSYCRIAIKHEKFPELQVNVWALKSFILKLYYVYFHLEGDIIYNNNAQMLASHQFGPIGTHFGGFLGLKRSICCFLGRVSSPVRRPVFKTGGGTQMRSFGFDS